MANTPTKSKTAIWEHFTLINPNTAQCNICRREYVYANGTGNYWTHLLNRHNIVNPNCKVQKGVDAAEKRLQKQQNQPKIDVKMKSLHAYEKDSSKYQDITRSIAKLFIVEMMPLHKINSDSWKAMSCQLDPRYEVPDSGYLKKVIGSMYANAREVMKARVKDVPFHSITCDTWTSKANDGFTAISAHGIDKNWNLKDYIIAVAHIKDRHTGKYLSDQLNEILSEFEIVEPIAVTDSGANIKCAIRLSGLDRFPCAAHTINLAVQAGLCIDGLKNNPDKKKDGLIDKCKNIVKHFKHSQIATANLRESAEIMEKQHPGSAGKCQQLLQEVPTRWNSCFDMLKRLLILKRAIIAQMTDEKLSLTSNEWKLIEQITEVLEPFKVISETLCGSKYTTMSYVYICITKLLKSLEETDKNKYCTPLITKFKKTIRENLLQHFSGDDMHILHKFRDKCQNVTAIKRSTGHVQTSHPATGSK